MRKMSRFVFPILLILVMLFVSSCSNDNSSSTASNSNLPELSIEGISWNTTAEDIVSKFGDPDEKQQEQIYSKDADMYRYKSATLFKRTPISMRVYFNSKGKDIAQISYFRYGDLDEAEEKYYENCLTELYGEPSDTCRVLNDTVYAMQWNDAARDTLVYYEYCGGKTRSITIVFHNKKYAKGLNPIQSTKNR